LKLCGILRDGKSCLFSFIECEPFSLQIRVASLDFLPPFNVHPYEDSRLVMPIISEPDDIRVVSPKMIFCLRATACGPENIHLTLVPLRC
jgi:hypothetical protein